MVVLDLIQNRPVHDVGWNSETMDTSIMIQAPRWLLVLLLVPMLSSGSNFVVGQFTLVKVTDARDKGAVCLDGSPPEYRIIPGYGDGKNSWLVYVEGGGWCSNIRDCTFRARVSLGSTNVEAKPDAYPVTGMFSRNPAISPDFYNWNHVWVRYCDGSSLTGNLEQPVLVSGSDPSSDASQYLYFRGQRVWAAIMEDLLAKGMQAADKGILTGCSAGGLTAIFHCDEFKALFPASASVKCVADAGFFLDVADITGGHSAGDFFRNVATLHNSTLNDRCTADRQQSETWKCFFPQYILPYIQTPLFILQSAYDSWQIGNLIAPNNLDPSGQWNSCKMNIYDCDKQQIAVLQEARNTMIRSLEPLHMESHKNGDFLISCSTHCMSSATAQWNNAPTFTLRGKTMAQSIGDWYYNRGSGSYLEQDDPYPTNPTCNSA